MRMDLDRLEDGRLERRFEIGADSPLLDGYDLEVREPLVLDAVLTNPMHRTYVLAARLRGEAFAPCRRCLTPTAVPIDERFRVVYEEPGREARRDEEPGDEDIVWIESGARTIEIGDHVRDRLFLGSDRYPVCREDCEGLCPVCGKNQNEDPCDCVVETPDHRWAALEAIEFDGEESG